MFNGHALGIVKAGEFGGEGLGTTEAAESKISSKHIQGGLVKSASKGEGLYCSLFAVTWPVENIFKVGP